MQSGGKRIFVSPGSVVSNGRQHFLGRSFHAIFLVEQLGIEGDQGFMLDCHLSFGCFSSSSFCLGVFLLTKYGRKPMMIQRTMTTITKEVWPSCQICVATLSALAQWYFCSTALIDQGTER